MSIVGSNALAGASGQSAGGAAGFRIDRSLRFNSGDSAYLNRTPTSAGNRKTWTWSGWVKRASLATSVFSLFAAYDSSNTRDVLRFESNKLNLQIGTSGTYRTETTDAVFRDLAWYHIVVAFDSTQSTAADRLKFYVNGVEQSVTGTPVNQNTQSTINNTDAHYIGARSSSGSAELFFDGYMAEINFVDGQALAATDFGEYDDNNVWQAKEFSGAHGPSAVTYGNNSQITIDSGNYYLSNQDGPNAFDGNSSTYIDCRLGTGSNNTTNIIFQPTGGIANVTKIRVNSNYADDYRINEGTWTSFSSGGSYTQIYSGSAFTLTKLEIRRTSNGGSDYGHRVTAYEINDSELVDIANDGGNGFRLVFDNSSDAALGTDSSGNSNNWTVNNLTAAAAGISNATSYFDTVTWTGNGSSQTISGLSFSPDFIWHKTRSISGGSQLYDSVRGTSKRLRSDSSDAESTLNGVTAFNSDGWTMTAGNNNNEPYVSWAWDAGDLVTNSAYNQSQAWGTFGDSNAKTNENWSHVFGGNGTAAPHVVANSGSTTVWTPSTPITFTKLEIYANNDGYGDITLNGSISTTGTVPSGGGSSMGWANVTSLISNNTLTSIEVPNSYNSDPTRLGAIKVDDKYLVDPGVIPVGSISSGVPTIASTVRANPTAGFSIVTYTGNGSNSQNVGHGLNTAPQWVIYKRRGGGDNWKVYHHTQTATKLANLNSASSFSTNNDIGTAPTSSVIPVSSSNSTYLNDSTNGTYLAYCWHEVSGFSKFGSYTSNGSTQTIDCGFKPAFVLIKSSSQAFDWLIYDNKRGNANLRANLTSAEGTQSANTVNFTANGFSVPHDGNGSINAASGSTYIYAAFAGAPDGTGIDSLIDTPTNYTADGNNGGNYATLNPLSGFGTLSNGNLDNTGPAAAWRSRPGTIGMSSGKWYFEWTHNGGTAHLLGIGTSDYPQSDYVGSNSKSWGYYSSNGQKYHSSSGSSYGDTWTTGDVIGVAFDADNGDLYFYKNGVAQNSGTAAYTGLTSGPYFPVISLNGTSNTGSINFGQRAFVHTPKTGHLSICTKNLPNPLIADGSTAFDTVLYTGNNQTTQTVALPFEPGLVWQKKRSGVSSHYWFDAIRGFSNTKALGSHTTAVEGNNSAYYSFSASGSDLTLGDVGVGNEWNINNQTHVIWTWNGGDLATTSDTTNYNQSQSFSAVTKAGGTSYSPTDSDTGFLNAYPTSNAFNSSGLSQVAYTNNNNVWIYVQLSTAITVSSTIKFGARNTVQVKINGTDYTYTGGDSTANQTTRTISFSGSLTEFAIRDNDNSGYSTGLSYLEVDGKQLIDPGLITAGSLNSSSYNTSRTWSSGIANSSSDFDQAATNAFNGNRSNKLRTGGNSVLVTLNFSPALTVASTIEILGEDWPTADFRYTVTVDGTTTTKDVTGVPATFNVSGSLTQITVDNNSSGGRTYLEWIKVDGKELIDSNVTPPSVPSVATTVRANPSAGFSICTYQSPNSSSNQSFAHSLNAKPDFVIVKNRDSSYNWDIYHSSLGYNSSLIFTSAATRSGAFGAEPTSSVVNTKTGYTHNGTDDYVALCWTAIKGYSAFGTYTGNGSADGPFIYTGFKVRWLLRKQTNSANHWHIVDTARDPENATDSWLFPNLSDAEGSGDSDRHTDLLSNGFKIRSAYSYHNTSGATYIYAAFAEHPLSLNGGLAR